MTTLAVFMNPTAYHILSYGTLLGTEIFQSFIGGIISFKALSRPQFSVLQQQIFPVYFGMQASLPAILAFTFPARALPPGGLAAVLDESNRFTVLLPLLAMNTCGLVNWLIVGPMTTKTIRERKHQETRDGKKYWDSGPKSEAMVKLNKKFSALHGVSSLINLIEILITVWYGFVLAEKL